MYDVKSFSIYEDNDYFHPYLYSVWHVKRDGEIVFHQKAPGKLTEPETLNCFIHTVSGTGKVFADNREFILNENSLILFETKKIASYFAFGGEWEYICYNFIPNTPVPYFEYNHIYEMPLLERENLIEQEMFNTMEIYDKYNCNLVTILFNETVFKWIHYCRKEQFASPYYSLIQQVVNYINNNLDKPLSINDLAVQFNFSTRHFRQIFTDIIGMSPKKYISLQKFQKAALLLKISRNSVGDISRSLGYYSPFQFCRDFKKRFGVTPSEYRNKNK